MSREKIKIIVILGPTASGKSGLAVRLAKKFNGEIISADSRQVYKGLDIGSGKITPDTNPPKADSTGQAKKKYIFTHKGISHYLLNVISPKKVFTALDFKKQAQKVINDIVSRNKIPIICGGTGFYIDALVGKTQIPEIKPNWELRKKLEKKSPEELFKTLKKLNPKRAKNIDSKNKRRLIRAIEIMKTPHRACSGAGQKSQYDPLFLGLTHPPEILKKRINQRINKMLKTGLVKEVKKLRELGLTWKRIYEFGFEYKYPALYLQKKISQEEMTESLKTQNWRYAKRQMTWVKRNQKILWIKSPGGAEKLIREFL